MSDGQEFCPGCYAEGIERVCAGLGPDMAAAVRKAAAGVLATRPAFRFQGGHSHQDAVPVAVTAS